MRRPRPSLPPISEIDWEDTYWTVRPRSSDPDPGSELPAVEQLIARYQAPYADEERREWIERRVRKWWQGRQGG
jgi:hypothetical protein